MPTRPLARRAAPLLALALALLSLASLPARAQEAAPPLEWDPTRTIVFAVGVLTWEHSGFAGFPQQGRRDAELVETWRAAGAREVVFLRDGEARLGRIQRELEALLGRSQPGQTLVLYYTGHGSHLPDGSVGFAPYDARSGSAASHWSVRSIVDAVEAGFAGDRVLLLADCCYSGALVEEAARRRDSRLAYASLVSAQDTSISTENWTFTECLLDGFRGQGLVDGDGDGALTLAELAGWCEAEMAFAEEQLTAFAASSRFPAATRLARVTAPRAHPRVGERLEVESEGQWWRARVLAVDGERVRVHYAGWDAKWDEWVEPARVRPYRPAERPVGQRVEVEWKGRWYPATITAARLGLHRVHYDGFEEVWDEWVSSDRVRDPGREAGRRERRRQRAR